MDLSTLAGRLRALRTHRNLTSRELDRRADLGEGHSSMIETGRRENIERATVRSLASALSCTVGWLLEGEGESPIAEPTLPRTEPPPSRDSVPA